MSDGNNNGMYCVYCRDHDSGLTVNSERLAQQMMIYHNNQSGCKSKYRPVHTDTEQ